MVERRSNDTRLALLEQSFAAMATDIAEVKISQNETKTALSSIVIMLAEQRGASKLVKWAGSTLIALASAIGGRAIAKSSIAAAERLK